MASVLLENISKKFGKKEVLKGIDLDINDGEFVVLVGASGCGKSTLLRIISGLENPDSGKIYIDNMCVNKVAPKNRDVAFVFQNYALYPHLNVKENISLGLKVRHIKKNEIEDRVSRAVEILKLQDYLKARPKELSGGQRQRVALARAIVREPKVFLMDEPLSNLDAKLRSEMRAEIKKLQQELQTTFIYVTHDQTEALTMGDRIAVLNEGEIQQFDTPQNVYNNPRNVFVSTFMGTSPMNIMEADIQDGFIKFAGIMLPTGNFKIDLTNHDKMYIGIRPEKIAGLYNSAYQFNMIKFVAPVLFEENLGSHKNVYFKMGDAQMCAMVDSDNESSEFTRFSINPEDLLFFDYETREPLH